MYFTFVNTRGDNKTIISFSVSIGVSVTSIPHLHTCRWGFKPVKVVVTANVFFCNVPSSSLTPREGVHPWGKGAYTYRGGGNTFSVHACCKVVSSRLTTRNSFIHSNHFCITYHQYFWLSRMIKVPGHLLLRCSHRYMQCRKGNHTDVTILHPDNHVFMTLAGYCYWLAQLRPGVLLLNCNCIKQKLLIIRKMPQVLWSHEYSWWLVVVWVSSWRKYVIILRYLKYLNTFIILINLGHFIGTTTTMFTRHIRRNCTCWAHVITTSNYILLKPYSVLLIFLVT